VLQFLCDSASNPSGWAHVYDIAGPAHKLQMFDFRFAWTAEFFSRNYSFWAGLLAAVSSLPPATVPNSCCATLLAAKTESESRAALFSSWAVIFFQFTLFLFIGLLLYVHYFDLNLPGPNRLNRSIQLLSGTICLAASLD